MSLIFLNMWSQMGVVNLVSFTMRLWVLRSAIKCNFSPFRVLFCNLMRFFHTFESCVVRSNASFHTFESCVSEFKYDFSRYPFHRFLCLALRFHFVANHSACHSPSWWPTALNWWFQKIYLCESGHRKIIQRRGGGGLFL